MKGHLTPLGLFCVSTGTFSLSFRTPSLHLASSTTAVVVSVCHVQGDGRCGTDRGWLLLRLRGGAVQPSHTSAPHTLLPPGGSGTLQLQPGLVYFAASYYCNLKITKINETRNRPIRGTWYQVPGTWYDIPIFTAALLGVPGRGSNTGKAEDGLGFTYQSIAFYCFLAL